MTLRLSQEHTDALRRRAIAEGASMQAVARRAVEEYLYAREPTIPIGVVIDEQLGRFAGAVEHLGRWKD